MFLQHISSLEPKKSSQKGAHNCTRSLYFDSYEKKEKISLGENPLIFNKLLSN